jgi:hypothetical protein
MIFQEQRRVLRIIYERLQHLDAPWAITGSLGFALHGMDVPINDIDLQTDRNGAYQIEEMFQPNIVRHVTFSESTVIRSYFGELKIAGIKVEIMGELQKRVSSGEWETSVDVRKYRQFIDFDGMRLPVLSLEYEEEAYRKLGRLEKAGAIRKWLTSHSC